MSVTVASDADHDTFVTALNELAEEVEQLREQNERLEDELGETQHRLAEVKRDRDRLRGRVNELEQQPRIEWGDAPKPTDIRIVDGQTSGEWAVSEAVRMSARSDLVKELEDRVDGLEETVESQDNDAVETDVDGSTPTPDGADQRTQAPQTPLGDCITLPEPVAEQELTANVKRARDVAADVIDYGRSVPAGYAVTSSELRTVLTAMNEGDGKAYTETVRRVMDYLDELGGDDVTLKETMGGQRTVIFDEEFVRRTVAWRQSASNDVVAGEKATG